MARPLRIEFPGAIHHVTSRMVGSWQRGRERLFRDERDYRRFLDRLEERVVDFTVRLYQFCLMSNHFHLVLETPQANLSAFMQSLSTAYTVYFNLRHQRHGHLLDGRYKSKLVSGDDYLLRLSRYVHQNPAWVSGWEHRPINERIQQLRHYRWSSYPGYIGVAPSYAFVDEEPILALVSGSKRNRRRHYREFVETGLAKADEEFEAVLKSSRRGIGDEPFQQWVEVLCRREMDSREVLEDVAFRRSVGPLDSESVLAEVCKTFAVEESLLQAAHRHLLARAAAARCLVRYSRWTQRQAALRLGVGTGAAVCRMLKQLQAKEEVDRSLSRKLRSLEARLRSRQGEEGATV